MRKIFISCIFLSMPYMALGAIHREQIKSYIAMAEQKYELPKNLLLAIIKQESDFRVNARLRNSHGLGQIQARTARSFCNLSIKRLYYYKDNIECAASYLQYQLDRYDDNIYLAVSAYNTGTPYVCNGRNYVRKLHRRMRVLNYDDDAQYCSRREKGLVFNKTYVRKVLGYWKSNKETKWKIERM